MYEKVYIYVLKSIHLEKNMFYPENCLEKSFSL